jgi:hypothetical protein
LGNSANGHLARRFGYAFAMFRRATSYLVKKGISITGRFARRAQPEREGSLFSAEKSDPFCRA